MSGARSAGRSEGCIWPSAAITAVKSAPRDSACLHPVVMAEPTPRLTGCSMTSRGRSTDLATLVVASRLASSTTMMWSTKLGTPSMAPRISFASLYAGMTTAIRLPASMSDWLSPKDSRVKRLRRRLVRRNPFGRWLKFSSCPSRLRPLGTTAARIWSATSRATFGATPRF